MVVEVDRNAQMLQQAHSLGSMPSLDVTEAAGESVLVISEGTGIAALMAAAAGANPVFCIQGSPMLHCMASQLFRDNHASSGCGHVHLCKSALERCVVRGALAVNAMLVGHHVVSNCCASSLHAYGQLSVHIAEPAGRQVDGSDQARFSMPTVLDAPSSHESLTLD